MIYEEGIFHIKNWKKVGFPVDIVVIPDFQSAKAFAELIFSSLNADEYENYIVQHIFYDTGRKIWIAYFWRDYKEDIDGGCLGIAFRSENAEILKIWNEL